MVFVRFPLPVLLSFHSIITTNINYNFLRLCSLCLIFFSQIISASSLSSKSNDRALTIAQSFDEYLCRTHILTYFFRKRHHPLFDNQQQFDNCKPYLILHSCFNYDLDTIRYCNQTELNRAKLILDKEIPKYCFTSSVYKTFYAQHLYSIAPSRTIVKCQIFVLFFLLISFIIKIRACC
jgi:hypothetical protein